MTNDMSKTIKNQSILLVDDEDVILEAIGMDLRQENYHVTLASSGEEAVALLKENQFDLVVTDLSMSGMTGMQVLKETKKLHSLTAVIILTGFGDMHSAIEALRLGADDYLCKPCDIDELVFRVERCLEIVRMKRALRASHDLLGSRVQERTAELEQTNTALNVLLKKREMDQKDIEEQVLHNLKQLVYPYLEKIKGGGLTSVQQTSLDIIKSNLKAVTSSFAVDFSSQHYRLSPTELQVANLIRMDMSSQEIAAVMDLSIETIHNHRKHIRRKLGITQKKVSLQKVLSSSSHNKS